MTKFKFIGKRRKHFKDEKGSIEGLPLQLMIMGIIASLGTAVIIGWISSIETPKYIGEVEFFPEKISVVDTQKDGIFEGSLKELSLRVLDSGGNPVSDADVIIEGSSIDNDHHRLYGKTDADGMLTFHDVSFKVIGDRITTISVSISGQGITGNYWTEIIILPS
ncbi:MAG: Ig-like domain-containing protein [Thermoplasmata archaeon]|nr:Ig-like domain-containing protein [Thermoplasmata archaeon]